MDPAYPRYADLYHWDVVDACVNGCLEEFFYMQQPSASTMAPTVSSAWRRISMDFTNQQYVSTNTAESVG